MSVLLTMLALAVPAQLPDYEPRFRGCNTPACDARVHAKQQLRRQHRALRRARRADPRKRMIRPHLAWLASTRRCESGGRYGTATGNGFWGAYQFTISSWRSVGGRGMPHQASKLEQDYRAVLLLYSQGRGAWPVCG
jgi:Transglycosylase-like domain